jgi:hypothetical protein
LILRALSFYATKCACYNKGQPEPPMKFHLFMCKGCFKKCKKCPTWTMGNCRT